MACDGSFTFDRQGEPGRPADPPTGRDPEARPDRGGARRQERPDRRTESAVAARQAARRRAVPRPGGRASPGRDLLLFNAPDGKYTLLHDRDWHLYWDDARQAVLKRLDRGELVAQCNLAGRPERRQGAAPGPRPVPRRHPQGARATVRPVRRPGGGRRRPAGGFRYKVTVQGRQGDAGVLWHYYLIAGPEGDQLIATFTLGLAQQAQFADQDLRLIGSLEWK